MTVKYGEPDPALMLEEAEAAEGEEGGGEGGDDPLFQCGQCSFTYRTIKEFMAHLKTIPGHEPVCVECSSSFQNFDNLRHHLRKYHVKSREVVCRECGKVSRSEDQQYHHWNYVHKVRYCQPALSLLEIHHRAISCVSIA